MRFPRKLAIGLGAAVAILLLVLLLVPFLFRDRIEARLKASLSESVNARVAWDGVGLGLIRDFPNVTLRVDGLTVAGNPPFAADTLVRMRRARLVLDLRSVVRHLRGGNAIVVREVVLQRPVATLRVLDDGTANWDIVRQRPGANDSGGAMRIALRELRIDDGIVTLEDRPARLAASVYGLTESLRGDFSADRFDLVTRTRADSVDVSFGGFSYLRRVALDLDARVDADMRSQRFAIADAALKLNALTVAFAGSVTTGSPNLELDLTFSSPGTRFANILSLVPAIYTRDFERIRSSGTMAVAGRVRGPYGPSAFPALAVRANVKDGAFQYEGLPLAARGIALDVAVDNPGGHADRTVIDLKRFRAVIGGRATDARMRIRTPISDPDVDLRLRGAVDLADLQRTVKLDSVSEMRGLVAADIAMRARLSDVDAQRYERVGGSGSFTASKVAVRAAALPHAVAIDTAAFRLTPEAAVMTAFAARAGTSDARATGSIDNLPGFLLRDEDLRGRAALTSRRIDLDEWISQEETEVLPVPPNIDFAVQATVAEVTYGKVTAANVRGGVRIRDQRATLDELAMETLRGTVVASGFYETTVATRPTYDMDLTLGNIDIPSAFAALTTVQTLAPIMRWAQGSVSGRTRMRGPMLPQMVPDFAAMSGSGNVETERLVIRGAPALGKLADALSIEQLRNPALGAVRTSYEIRDGRVIVKPFVVRASGIDMTVAGSNGIDQSLAYDLGLLVPRALLGSAATRLASQARAAGVELPPGDVVRLGARITGTVTAPAVKPDFRGAASGARQVAEGVVRQQVEARTAAVRERVDSAAVEARRRAAVEAERLVAEAERKAGAIRDEARDLAESMRREAGERADSLNARATNPAARIAAKAAGDRIRREADQQAERITREADVRAGALVEEARRKAGAVEAVKP